MSKLTWNEQATAFLNALERPATSRDAGRMRENISNCIMNCSTTAQDAPEIAVLSNEQLHERFREATAKLKKLPKPPPLGTTPSSSTRPTLSSSSAPSWDSA